MRKWFLLGMLAVGTTALADVYLVNGERMEGEVHEVNGQLTLCTDSLCIVLPPEAIKVSEGPVARSPAPSAVPDETPLAMRAGGTSRQAQGYMKPAELLAFLHGEAAATPLAVFADKSVWMILLLVLVGGLLMNLTPCVLPMVPINLMVVGKSAARGALYGLGIALAYGVMGLLAALGGMAFGEIQSSPWFNLAIALVFVVLGLSMLGVFFIDFSKGRGALAQKKSTMLPGFFAFFMGMVSAVLAGACVAPILIAVLLLTAKLYAEGTVPALGLPFVLGLGMALPWPFAGAGLQILPKPGDWMKYVNKAFGVLVLGFAAWYGYLAYTGFCGAPSTATRNLEDAGAIRHLTATPETFPDMLPVLEKPVFVDCWATWCKNCVAMEKTTFRDEKVVEALQNFTVIKLQAEDISALKQVPGFETIKGLPAFVIFE
ncbi:MAG: cytochrome c biogenesis protein CcdA [Kiritimatiellia bacterium]